MKKKGFTLIELLAVIVILAIIALIATPLVLKYIEKSRKESKVDSAYSFVRNLETEIANYSIKNNGKKYNKSGLVEIGDLTDIDTTVKGDTPSNGKVCLSSLGQVEKAMFEYGKYYVSYDGKKGSISDKDTYDNFSCSGNGNENITTGAGLYDENDVLLYSWDELVNNYDIDVENDWLSDNGELLGDMNSIPGILLSSNNDLKRGTKLVIDSSVTKIGNAALISNETLKEVVIPNSVKSIGFGALSGIQKIENLDIPNSVESIKGSAISNCPNLKKVTLSDNIKSLENDVFLGCTSLTDIVIPDSVTTIGYTVFSGCTNLTKITVPANVKSIGYGAFKNCSNLSEVNLLEGINTIDEQAFANCTSLINIKLPNSLTSIHANTFTGSDNLINIYYKGTVPGETWGAINATVITDY